MNELEIKDLKFSIGESQILNGVDLSAKSGEKLGIIGPNGSGKTTLFNCISGFNRPQSGSIVFDGKDITHAAPSKRALHGLGRVFQNFGIFREMTVEENIILALEGKQGSLVLPWSKKNRENKEKTKEYLELVGLEGKLGDKAGSLSGGQMRLLEISRAIAFGSSLFLLDEPTAGVSPKMKGQIISAMERVQDLGKTVFIIEHDLNFIQRLCDRIIVLDMGRVVLDGTPDEVRSDKRLQEIYFGTGASDKTTGGEAGAR